MEGPWKYDQRETTVTPSEFLPCPPLTIQQKRCRVVGGAIMTGTVKKMNLVRRKQTSFFALGEVKKGVPQVEVPQPFTLRSLSTTRSFAFPDMQG